MKHIAFLVIAFFVAAVVAQDKPPVKEAVKPEATKEAAKPAAETKKQAAAGAALPRASHQHRDHQVRRRVSLEGARGAALGGPLAKSKAT